MESGDDRLIRAVSVDASGEMLYAWLGNLRLAPYSYDWLDNFGRRSPRQLRPDLGPLEPGQRVMSIFTVESVEPGRSVTLRMRPGLGRAMFGEVWVTYAIGRDANGQARLIAALRFGATGGRLDAVRRRLMAWGDLLMMRKQLLTLRDLAHEAEHPKNS